MSKQQLSRRKVLAGLATAGGGSAFVGSGASALFTDEETFTNNSIQASTSVSGELNLDITPRTFEKTDDFGNVGWANFGNNGRTMHIPAWDVAIPNSDGNNPAYVWLRLAACPEPRSCARNIEIELKCDDSTIIQGRLDETADQLRRGIPIDPGCADIEQPGSQRCFQPDDSVTITLDWSLLDGFDGCESDIEIPFEFHARQCRYNEGRENPFYDRDQDRTSCYVDKSSDGQAISWIGFCTGTDQPLDPGIKEIVEQTDAGEPLSVRWSTETEVDFVVIKGANIWTVYDYRSDDGMTSNVATFEDTGADFAGYVDPAGGSSSCFCSVAKYQLGTCDFDIARTNKGNYEGGSFEFGETQKSSCTCGADAPSGRDKGGGPET